MARGAARLNYIRINHTNWLQSSGLDKKWTLVSFVGETSALWFVRSSGVEVNLRPTVSRPVCLGVRHLSGTRDQFFFLYEISFRQLRVCYSVEPSLTRGRVCNLLYNFFWMHLTVLISPQTDPRGRSILRRCPSFRKAMASTSSNKTIIARGWDSTSLLFPVAARTSQKTLP
jgi:hypothetical protein